MLSYYNDSETAVIPAVCHYMRLSYIIPHRSQFGIIVNYYKQFLHLYHASDTIKIYYSQTKAQAIVLKKKPY